MKKQSKLLLSIGSNMCDRIANINLALKMLSERCDVGRCSSFYETEPYGNSDQDWFINVAVAAKTELTPYRLLTFCQHIEYEIGRRPAPKWTARVIDIDIIFYDTIIYYTKRLTIPHPLMQERRFVLTPAKEIVGEWMHPVLGKSIAQLETECDDKLVVRLYNPNASSIF